MNECEDPLYNDCGENSVCINTFGGFICECKRGIIQDYLPWRWDNFPLRQFTDVTIHRHDNSPTQFQKLIKAFLNANSQYFLLHISVPSILTICEFQ